MNTRTISGKPLAWLLTLIYFTSYVTRKNFAAIIQQVITDTGFAKDTLSVILVCMTVSYGVGQIVNGRLGDKFRPTNLIFIGLIMATSVNILFPFFASSIPAMAILWLINGYAHSMMWPPIVKILVANCNDEEYGYSVVRISWGSSFGTIMVYVLSVLIISLTSGFKGVFWVSAAFGIAATVIWFFAKRRIKEEPDEQKDIVPADKSCEQKKLRFPKAAILPFALIILAIIFQGMLRDGVATWMPTYLTEVHGWSNEESILSAVLPAIFSIACFSVSGAIHKRFFKNEVVCAAVVFGVALISAAVLYVLFGKNAYAAMICLTVITGCMHGVNLMLITHVPKRFKKHGNISTIAGLVNACTYIGEAIFTYGLAMLSIHLGWKNCIGICALIAVAGTLGCILAARPWKKFYSEDQAE